MVLCASHVWKKDVTLILIELLHGNNGMLAQKKKKKKKCCTGGYLSCKAGSSVISCSSMKSFPWCSEASGGISPCFAGIAVLLECLLPSFPYSKHTPQGAFKHGQKCDVLQRTDVLVLPSLRTRSHRYRTLSMTLHRGSCKVEVTATDLRGTGSLQC